MNVTNTDRIDKWIYNAKGSQVLELKFTKEKGRFFVAKQDLVEGDLIARSEPYILAVNEQRKQYVCDYCAFYHENNLNQPLAISCVQCNEVYYCSDDCFQQAKHQYHDLECNFGSNIATAMKSNIKKSEKKVDELVCLARLIGRVFTRKLKEMDQQGEEIHAKETGFTYEDVLHLCSNANILPSKKLELLKEVSQLVYQAMKKDPHLSQCCKTVGIRDVFEMACREECNAFGLYYPIHHLHGEVKDSSEERLFAFGFYPLISLFNHSCSPNMYKILKGRTYYYHALHNIPKGTELCHSYIDLDKNTNQRRQELLSNYGFHCVCNRCNSDEIDDIFMEKYLCRRYGCGGLLVKQQGSTTDLRTCHKCGEEEEEDY